MEIQKTNEPNTLQGLQKISQNVMVQALSRKDFKRASDLAPNKIELAYSEPKVFELTKALGDEIVLGQIEFELIKLASLMSVGGNLNNAQIQFIARQLLNSYPTESIADFKICFERGAFGSYGPIQRMDGITVRDWMAKYLDEKYLVMEDLLMKEKDNIYKPVNLTEIEMASVNRIDVDAMLKEYGESIKAFEAKSILPMSEDEIEAEGQERPKREVYRYDETEAGIKLKEVHGRIFAAQEKAVRERHPEWSEQEIEKYCQELREYTIYQETKPKWSSHLGKIWEEKKKKQDQKFY
jgi:hypothetical protein